MNCLRCEIKIKNGNVCKDCYYDFASDTPLCMEYGCPELIMEIEE